MPDRHWNQLHRYWLSKHVGGLSPSRSDIDPIIDNPQLAKNLILIDARDNVIYRLVAGEVVERHGLDLTGRISGASGQNAKAVAEWRPAVEHVSKELQPRLLASRVSDGDVVRNVMILFAQADRKAASRCYWPARSISEHFTRGAHIQDLDARGVQVG